MTHAAVLGHVRAWTPEEFFPRAWISGFLQRLLGLSRLLLAVLGVHKETPHLLSLPCSTICTDRSVAFLHRTLAIRLSCFLANA